MDNIPTMTVLAHRSSHRDTVLDTTCLLCGAQPETLPTFGPARPGPMSGDRLAGGLRSGSTRRWGNVLPRCATNCGSQLHWSGGRWPCVPPPCSAHMECSGPHTLGTEFIRHVIEESIRVWYAHAKARATLLKARMGPGSTMAWVLQELRPHQQAEREGVRGNFWDDNCRQEGDIQVFPDSPSFRR